MEQTSAKREKRKSLLRIAIPIILSSCLQISYDITDMFWVGKLEAEKLRLSERPDFISNWVGL